MEKTEYTPTEIKSLFAEAMEAVTRKITQPFFITGELMEFRTSAQSGWSFFIISDRDARVNCMMPPEISSRIVFQNDKSYKVHIEGVLRISEKDKFPEVTIVVKSIYETGPGEFEKMKEKLFADLDKKGLLTKAELRKVPTSPPPKRIGIIAPCESKAFADIESILGNIEGLSLIKRPMKEYSPDSLIAELQQLSSDIEPCEVIIISRGGGNSSIYNDPVFLHFVASCEVPIISATGHHEDKTLLDLIAAETLSTPTSAAKWIEELHRTYKSKIESAKKRNRYLSIGVALGIFIPIVIIIIFILIKHC